MLESFLVSVSNTVMQCDDGLAYVNLSSLEKTKNSLLKITSNPTEILINYLPNISVERY